VALGNILERKAVTTMAELLQETLVTLMSLGAGFGMLALLFVVLGRSVDTSDHRATADDL